MLRRQLVHSSYVESFYSYRIERTRLNLNFQTVWLCVSGLPRPSSSLLSLIRTQIKLPTNYVLVLSYQVILLLSSVSVAWSCALLFFLLSPPSLVYSRNVSSLTCQDPTSESRPWALFLSCRLFFICQHCFCSQTLLSLLDLQCSSRALSHFSRSPVSLIRRTLHLWFLSASLFIEAK